MSRKRKWLFTGGLGASLFGFGVCAVMESAFLKHSGTLWYVWTVLGTLSLASMVMGIVLLIKAGFMERDMKQGSQ